MAISLLLSQLLWLQWRSRIPVFSKTYFSSGKYDDLLDKINEKELDLLEEARRKSTAIVEKRRLKLNA